MSSEFCRTLARQTLDQLQSSRLPVDVEAVAAAHGLTVRHVTLAGGLSGRLVSQRMVIEVNKKHHRHKQRFTIAHEIGHFVLGHSPLFNRSDNYSISDPIRVNERQANAFASELLMPENLVREHWGELRRAERPVDKMADRFEVSAESMFYRLQDLDLLGLPPTR